MTTEGCLLSHLQDAKASKPHMNCTDCREMGNLPQSFPHLCSEQK